MVLVAYLHLMGPLAYPPVSRVIRPLLQLAVIRPPPAWQLEGGPKGCTALDREKNIIGLSLEYTTIIKSLGR